MTAIPCLKLATLRHAQCGCNPLSARRLAWTWRIGASHRAGLDLRLRLRRLRQALVRMRLAFLFAFAGQALIRLQSGIDHHIVPAAVLMVAADPSEHKILAFRAFRQRRPDRARRQFDLGRQRDDRVLGPRRRPDALRRLRQALVRTPGTPAWEPLVRPWRTSVTEPRIHRTAPAAARKPLVGMPALVDAPVGIGGASAPAARRPLYKLNVSPRTFWHVLTPHVVYATCRIPPAYSLPERSLRRQRLPPLHRRSNCESSCRLHKLGGDGN